MEARCSKDEAGGGHMAVSPDQLRMIFFQDYPEYDKNSLLKEYKGSCCAMCGKSGVATRPGGYARFHLRI